MPGAGDDSLNPVARAYDRWAASYDTDTNATRDLDAVALRRSGLDLRNRDVVELGAGTGKNTAWIAPQARSIIALDFSAAMLAHAQRRLDAGNVQFVRHDIREPWPLADASADAVISNLVLEHVDDLRPVFAEAARVLRPGGVAYFAELHPVRQARGSQAQFTDAERGERVFVDAFVHTAAEYQSAATAAGLRVAALDEAVEDGVPAGTPPRLLILRAELKND